MLCGATPAPQTIVKDATALHRLQRNSGITLQWIGFVTPQRGRLRAHMEDGVLALTGSQQSPDGSEQLTIDGYVELIDERSFTFVGDIVILNSPTSPRECVRQGRFNFRAAGKRRYWRLQQMQSCDNLTDYVDIYF